MKEDRLTVIEETRPRLPDASLRLTIDDAALAANWRALDRLSGAARAGAAVKADAYGLGARVAVPVLAKAGARDFFVAHWQEAAEIADLVAPGMVSVLHGAMTGDEAAYARACGFRPVINSLHQARLWLAAGGGRCDLMVDTGMSRLGLPASDWGDPMLSRLDVDILLSHLSSAEEETPRNGAQLAAFQGALGQIAHHRASLANSAGITLGAPYHGDVTRPGLALYGGVACAALAPHIAQVARPEAMVIQTRDVAPGEAVGYNATFVAPRAMRIGIVALGYADGYLRTWSGRGAMLWRGGHLPVVGRVSMDMTAIDLSAAPDLREGDWVAVDYDLPGAAAISGLSQYELLTVLGRRFARGGAR